jgi:lysophospholipase L1-like esterase
MAYQIPQLSVPPITAQETSSDQSAAPTPLGVWTPLQGEVFLRQFYEALDELATSQRTKVRVLAYGASHTQADLYTDYLRRYLQLRFGDGGHGFVHMGRVNRYYKTAGTEISMLHLRARHAQSIRNMQDGALGLLGAEIYGNKVGAYGEVEWRESSPNTRFELAYLKAKEGGRLSIQVDKKEITRINTRAQEEAMGFFPFETLPGPRVIRAQVQGGGTVHLLGLTAENDQPGIVVDTLGINGSRMSNQLKWHEGLWTQAIQQRDPSLVIYAFGTNETMDLHQKMGLYEQEVRDVIARLKRAAPSASCLLLAPFDFPRQEGELWKTRSRLLEILEVQKRVSQEEGCAFWDAYSYMGGPGSMHKWALAHPPHASSDHIHLTAIGYVRAAIAFTDALMRRYDAEMLAGARLP